MGRSVSAIRGRLQARARHELDSRRQNGGEEQRQRNDRKNLEGQRSRVQTSVNIWQLRDLTILQSPFIINLHGTVDQINTCLIDTGATQSQSVQLQLRYGVLST